jgi:hypothetical protein
MIRRPFHEAVVVGRAARYTQSLSLHFRIGSFDAAYCCDNFPVAQYCTVQTYKNVLC